MNQIIPIQPGAGLPIGALPDHMRAFADQSAMNGLGEGGGHRRVQLKGGQINFLAEDGKPMGIVTSADGQAVQFPQFTSSAQIIIVGMMPAGGDVYRQWFATAYQEGKVESPDCWSADNTAPSPKSFSPQATACAQCPQNVSGSSSTGKGKACGSRKRLAVVFAGDPEMRVFTMDLAPTALFGTSARQAEGFYTLAGYAKMLKQAGAIWEGVVTEVSFAEGANTGVRFRAVGYTSAETMQRALALGHDADTHSLLTVDFPEKKKADQPAAPAYAAPAAPAAPAYAAPAATPSVDKTVLLTNPAFPPALLDWARHPAVTVADIKQQLTAYGIYI